MNRIISNLTADRQAQLDQFVVTAAQISQIEQRLFAAGMPIAALMEKVAGLIALRIRSRCVPGDRIGILVGSGHNGGDALVVARELHLSGYPVKLYQPLTKLKDLTAAHARYAASLGIPTVATLADLHDCALIVDGLFGFGLTRSLEGELAAAVNQLNQMTVPIVSIDLPSGLHTDTGAALGTAVRATHTLCLGLWKLAFLQESALEYIGSAELIDFGLPLADIQAVLGTSPAVQRITAASAIAALPLPRPASTHKYKQGHLLLVCGSRQFMGAAILAGSAAQASGVGMLSIAVPQTMQPLLIDQLPDALVIGCPEDETGAIAHLPDSIDLQKYQAIACGCGLTSRPEAVVQQLLASDRPLLLDADGLNILASHLKAASDTLKQRQAPTVLTPHWGEFKRLFPDLAESGDRLESVQQSAQQSGAIVLLKGARTAIASPQNQLWLNPDSTPALARGGSGDILTGLMGGLLAQGVARGTRLEAIVQSAAWWHSQAGILAAQSRTELGVDAHTLSHFLIPALSRILSRSAL